MRLPFLLAAATCLSQAALADLTLIGRSSLSALNMPSQGSETLFVKQHQLRRDLTERGRSYSYLYDLKKMEVAIVDHFLRRVEVHTLSSEESGNRKGERFKLSRTGRKHAMDEWNCEEFVLDASLPAEMGNEKVTVVLDGEVWLERGSKIRRQIAPFVQAVEADDFFVGAAAPGRPVNTQAQGINEVMRKVLGTGMICAADIRLKYEGNGPMADLGRRMATKAGIVYESISDAPLRDELFMPPRGYQEIRR